MAVSKLCPVKLGETLSWAFFIILCIRFESKAQSPRIFFFPSPKQYLKSWLQSGWWWVAQSPWLCWLWWWMNRWCLGTIPQRGDGFHCAAWTLSLFGWTGRHWDPESQQPCRWSANGEQGQQGDEGPSARGLSLLLLFVTSPDWTELQTQGQVLIQDYFCISRELFCIWALSNKHDNFSKASLREKLISSLH